MSSETYYRLWNTISAIKTKYTRAGIVQIQDRSGRCGVYVRESLNVITKHTLYIVNYKSVTVGVRGYNLCLIITSMDSLTIHTTSTRSILYISTAFKPTLVGEIIFYTLYN